MRLSIPIISALSLGMLLLMLTQLHLVLTPQTATRFLNKAIFGCAGVSGRGGSGGGRGDGPLYAPQQRAQGGGYSSRAGRLDLGPGVAIFIDVF